MFEDYLKRHSQNCSPMTPQDFIRRVLVPEAAVILIAQDRGLQRQDALRIRSESSAYGLAMFPEEKRKWQPDTGGSQFLDDETIPPSVDDPLPQSPDRLTNGRRLRARSKPPGSSQEMSSASMSLFVLYTIITAQSLNR